MRLGMTVVDVLVAIFTVRMSHFIGFRRSMAPGHGNSLTVPANGSERLKREA